jgi:thiol:disulfide interchange protein DsbD
MQIKILLYLSFFILISHTLSENISSSKILTSEESFKIFIKEDENNLIISMKINERSYIYSDHLSLRDSNLNVFHDIIGKKIVITDEFYGESSIYKNSLELIIPDSYKYIGKVLYLSYQGCLENIICYPKITKKIKLTKFKNSPISFDFL